MAIQCSVVLRYIYRQTAVPEVCISIHVPDSGQVSIVVTSYSLTVQGGISPLYTASECGHTAVVDILLEAGADVHQATTQV